VQSTILVTEHAQTQGEIINIGNQEQEITIRDLVQTIAKVMGKSISLNELPDTPGSPARRCPDTSKIKSLTGFVPQVALEEGITRMYAWYKDKLDSRHE
jgi:UDP-glucose 4-epimerase/UDP-glucuronate decarboxylase